MILESANTNHESFMQQSISMLKYLIQSEQVYPGYPIDRLTYTNGAGFDANLGKFYLPDNDWYIPSMQAGFEANITNQDIQNSISSGLLLDQQHRPVHPWVDSMLCDDVGVYTGKGFYRQWGPNYTADPVVIRTDSNEPMTLLIRRNDTHSWALAGGFIEPDEYGDQAAMREAEEETLLPLSQFNPTIKHLYTGPIADLRMTANAWPETQAYLVKLDPQLTHDCLWKGLRGDPNEVEDCGWFTMSQANQVLLGSHRLLVNLGFESIY